MKKAKIMLMGIAIIGVVAGALAFKAKTYNRRFCTLTTVGFPKGGLCTINAVSKLDGPTKVWYTSTFEGHPVDLLTPCTTLACITSTTLDVEGD